MWTFRKRAAGGVKLPSEVWKCDGRLQSTGRADKRVPKCGNPSACPAIRSVVRPALPLLWCPGATDHGWTGTLGALGELERMVEVSRQRCRSRWRPW
jgi:hypothetical protein